MAGLHGRPVYLRVTGDTSERSHRFADDIIATFKSDGLLCEKLAYSPSKDIPMHWLNPKCEKDHKATASIMRRQMTLTLDAIGTLVNRRANSGIIVVHIDPLEPLLTASIEDDHEVRDECLELIAYTNKILRHRCAIVDVYVHSEGKFDHPRDAYLNKIGAHYTFRHTLGNFIPDHLSFDITREHIGHLYHDMVKKIEKCVCATKDEHGPWGDPVNGARQNAVAPMCYPGSYSVLIKRHGNTPGHVEWTHSRTRGPHGLHSGEPIDIVSIGPKTELHGVADQVTDLIALIEDNEKNAQQSKRVAALSIDSDSDSSGSPVKTKDEVVHPKAPFRRRNATKEISEKPARDEQIN